MASRYPLKETVKVQRTIVKSSGAKKPAPSTSANFTLKKGFSVKKTTQLTPLEANNTIAMDSRKRTNTVPATTPKKENKSVPMPGSVTKSTKKSWKRRPMPAHSGVPIPEKMKLMMSLKRKQLLLNAKQSE